MIKLRYLLVWVWVFYSATVLSCLESNDSDRSKSENCPYFSTLDKKQVINALQEGNFSGVLDGTETLKFFGCYENYGFYHYEREFSNKRLARRLVVLDSDRGYLGMYSISLSPVAITHGAILFSFSNEYGNRIDLTQGTLPKSIYLDGEVSNFFQ